MKSNVTYSMAIGENVSKHVICMGLLHILHNALSESYDIFQRICCIFYN